VSLYVFKGCAKFCNDPTCLEQEEKVGISIGVQVKKTDNSLSTHFKKRKNCKLYQGV
jgi:hypothetical protein